MVDNLTKIKKFSLKQVKKVLIITFSVLIIVLVFYGANKKIISHPNFNNNVDEVNGTNTTNINEQVSGASAEIENNQISQEQGEAEITTSEKQQSQGTDLLAAEKNESEIRIRIVKKPQGEEPDWVEEAWVGLEIPVIKGTYKQKGGQEVISGEFRQADNYVVPVQEALAILKKKNPAAEKWWRDNVAVDEIYGIGFERDVCELIEN